MHQLLACVDTDGAHAVHDQWYPESGHGNSVSRDPMNTNVVIIYYVNSRFPLDIAEWALAHGHADRAAAAQVIAAL
jgi:hypothetical protein